MLDSIDSFAYRVRFIIVGLLILASLAFLVVLLSAPATAQHRDPETAEMTMSMYDGPNAVTNSMGMMATQAMDSVEATGQVFASTGAAVGSGFAAVGNGFVSVGSTVGSGFASAGKWTVSSIANTGSFISNTAQSSVSALGRSAKTTASFAGKGLVGGLKATVTASSSAVGLVSNAPVVSATVAPEEIVDKPQIDTKRPATVAKAQPAADPAHDEHAHDHSQAASVPQVQTAATTPTQTDNSAQWPIQGDITTHFGVPHWPYQATHSGIDISDGWVSGVTQIRPIKPGKVVETVRGYSGLGHYVVIDHGNGLTSVYAHLASILVNPGQEVDKSTILGMEGSTGASTGTHLHLEIRINGVSVNPLDYLPKR